MPKGENDEMGKHLLHMILAYAYPKMVRMDSLGHILGGYNRVRCLLNSLDAAVYEDGRSCGLTDWEAERLEELNKKWEERNAS